VDAVVESKKTALLKAWDELIKSNPMRIRDAAKALNVSEAELLETKLGKGGTRLSGTWPDLLTGFKTLGRVMSLTRNDSCVLEHKGTFQKIDIMGSGPHSMATVIGPIESRVFFGAWHAAYAVVDKKPDRELKSIQIFDQAGDAVLKVYLQEESNVEAYNKLIEAFTAEKELTIEFTPYPKEELNGPKDVEAFLQDWSSMQDTHDFFGMIRKHQVNRFDALRIAEGKFTYKVELSATEQLLNVAAESKFPIMIFAGSKGNIQIHQGKVKTIRLMERGEEVWLNVLDPDFNMHLKLNEVETSWVVTKPTEDGPVTAVELFDNQKRLIAQFFGLRKPGIPQRKEWEQIVEGLPRI
jgi:putative hemin transport protein